MDRYVTLDLEQGASAKNGKEDSRNKNGIHDSFRDDLHGLDEVDVAGGPRAGGVQQMNAQGGIKGVQQTQFSRSQALNNIGASKDKAQIGSAISLSLVLIGILKTIINDGPNGMKYYTPMLYLVSITLGLQLIAGLLSLYITMKKNFFNQYQGNLWRHCGKLCCSCCFSNNQPKSTGSLCRLEYTNENTPLVSVSASKADVDVTAIDDDDIHCCQGICGNNSGTYEPGEVEIFLQYNIWKADETRALLGIKKAELEIKNIESLISDLNVQHSQSNTSKTQPLQLNEQQILQEHKREIDDENAKLNTVKKGKMEFEKYIELGKILQTNVEKLRCKKIYMEAGCLQNILCVLVYLIVTLNSVIFVIGIITNKVPHSNVHHSNTTA